MLDQIARVHLRRVTSTIRPSQSSGRIYTGVTSKILSSNVVQELRDGESVDLGTQTTISTNAAPLGTKHERGASHSRWHGQRQKQRRPDNYDREFGIDSSDIHDFGQIPAGIQAETTIEVRKESVKEEDHDVIHILSERQNQGSSSRSGSVNSGNSERELHIPK